MANSNSNSNSNKIRNLLEKLNLSNDEKKQQLANISLNALERAEQSNDFDDQQKERIQQLIVIKTAMNKNKNSKNNKKIDCASLTFDQDEEKEKLKTGILKLLMDINEKLEASNDVKIATGLVMELFKLIVEDQQSIRKRQESITMCLKKYEEILENYGDQNITIEKLNELSKILRSNNVTVKKLL